LTPNELVLTFRGSYVCVNFGENRSRNATVRVPTDGQTHTQTHTQPQTDFIICPMLYAIAMGQIIIPFFGWTMVDPGTSCQSRNPTVPRARCFLLVFLISNHMSKTHRCALAACDRQTDRRTDGLQHRNARYTFDCVCGGGVGYWVAYCRYATLHRAM